jgi:hypothetical protein
MEHHCLTNIDKEGMRGTCSVCGKIDIKRKSAGGGNYRYVCGNKMRELKRRYSQSPAGKRKNGRNKGRGFRYRKHVGPTCERCGVTPPHEALMDGHHRDGNHKNNEKENIESVCSSCHRLIHLDRLDLIKPIEVAAHAPDQSNQLKAMTDCYVDECEKVAALSLRLDHLNREMDDCLEMTEEDKTRYWRDRAFRAEAAIKAKGGEYDQGG